ncbi:RNA methyltransferase [Trichlorobacter ammonificans]|uniref:tRNA (cytidine/uridine-2'-O-)-methyltransferase TrmJ n=1 Tax=Trichlorobacter ammonificans TaxID=2916410 RepID=A0ABN8HC54_9BACT|nr:RNA methyltransferase [Trichlorobacter ammonificans]CAH2030279.1 tRNA (cytidine/uridine-2'-O-)-methyltransferase TrmJ [Trichlorobacter ammonificans]
MHDSLAIVLVEPQSPGNIGMVCRAMKNMGIHRLRLVKGCDRLHPEALKFAVSARDLLEQAQLFPSLEAALADTTISVATTRRTGKYRRELMTPPQVARMIHQQAGGMAALVFGREDHGLTTDELSRCTLQATIPSSSDYGSLNLAQSVLIFCYELFSGTAGEVDDTARRQLAASGELEPLFDQMQATLLSIGYLNPQNPDHIMRSLRRILFRSGLDSREAALLRGMFSQIDWAARNFDGRKKTR